MNLTEIYINTRYALNRVLPWLKLPRKREVLYDITFVLMIRDESEYVLEWMNFHTLLFTGKRVHFYIIDNKSTDGLRHLLLPFIENGTVTYYYANAETHPQRQLYTHAIRKFIYKTLYMAFFDTDEFLVPTDGALNVWDFITNRINVGGGLVVNWLCFGSSGHKTKPEGSVLESYLYRSEYSYSPNSHVKTICNPRTVLYFVNPHNPVFKKGHFAVDESDNMVTGPFNEAREYRFLRLHHYAAKSLEEQERKVARGWGKRASLTKRKIKHAVHDENAVYDDTAVRVLEFLRK